MATVNGLELPAALEADLRLGRDTLDAVEKARFAALLMLIPSPKPDLMSLEWLTRENLLWSKRGARHYLGVATDQNPLGRIDPTRTLIIGCAGDDSPLALGAGTAPPRVIYLEETAPESYWVEIAPNYEAFIAMIRP